MSKFAQLRVIAQMREGVVLDTMRENPITRRSKKSIVDAMMDLLHEKSFEKITVKEIMEKADMARRTFYGNFKSKDEIIQYYFQNLFRTWEERADQYGKYSPKKLTEILFELVLEDKDNMMMAKKQGLFNMAMVERYSNDIAGLMSKSMAAKGNRMALNYAAGFYIGGVWRVIGQWLGEGANETPKKMADMFQSMMNLDLITDKHKEVT